MGLEPVGLVQGFCVMKWGWYGAGSAYMRGAQPYSTGSNTYSESWRCPHGFVSNEHRTWGQNFEQLWIEQAWGNGFGAAYSRMLEEAEALGAHGVVGLVDLTQGIGEAGVIEFRIYGTAVKVGGQSLPNGIKPFTTYLAGQRLAKLVEAGYMPVSIAAALSSVRIWPYCVTEYLLEGQRTYWGWAAPNNEIDQVSRAHMAARQIAREHVRKQLGGDSLHGAQMTFTNYEADGDVQCVLRGNRVRRFKDFDPLPPPRLTVRLS
jgi:hypothetical protein